MAEPFPMQSPLINEHEAAERLGLSFRTLQRWRYQGGGPRFVKVGPAKKSAVRYRESDIDEYIASGVHATTGELG
jgi:predicted DNA-binding transcriptional regulator AlpA